MMNPTVTSPFQAESGEQAAGQYLYVFLDEGGNFDFSAKGTRYFTLTALTTSRSFAWDSELLALKYDEIERGLDLEYFHASVDEQATRHRVFDVIERHIAEARIDSVVVEKRKTIPDWQTPPRLYPEMLGYLLRYIMRRERLSEYTGLIVMTDVIPVRKQREAIRKGILESLSGGLPAGFPYRVLHHDSKACPGLQVADYCNWAIYRKWDRGDERSYEHIRSAIRSEFDIFRRGKKIYY